MTTTSDGATEDQLHALYAGLLDGWNRRDADAMAALFTEDADLVGFDGTHLSGRAAIAESHRQIFADHVTPAYVGSIIRTRLTGTAGDGAIVRAVAGLIPPGQDDLDPAGNSIQTVVASRVDGRWAVQLFTNTPAQFHGRPEESEQLTARLRALLPVRPAPEPPGEAPPPSEPEANRTELFGVDVGKGFTELIGLAFDVISGDEVVVRLPIQPALHQPYGIVHGGVWCAIVETAASIGAAAWFGQRGSVVGVANHTNFLRAAREGVAIGRATPIHRGRLQQLWMVEITDADDRLLARGEVRLQNLSTADNLGRSSPG